LDFGLNTSPTHSLTPISHLHLQGDAEKNGKWHPCTYVSLFCVPSCTCMFPISCMFPLQ